MGIFSKSKNEDELVLVFDVGSSSVGGALFCMQDSGIPKIIYSIREDIPLHSELNPEKFFHSTIAVLKIVAGKICLKGVGTPNRIFCVLSSPWFASQTRTIRLEKSVPFVFTNKLADSLIDKEISLFEAEHSLNNMNDNSKRAIELKNMSTILNGYTTSSPFGQKVKELEMNIFISISEEMILKQIENAINTHFHLKVIKFCTFVITSYTVARDLFINKDNFILVNIGGEVTDISLVKKDSIRESVSFPTGRNHITRGVADKLKCSLSEAKSYISLYKDSHMATTSIKKIEPTIKKLKKDWLKMFEESLSSMSNDVSIPSTIFFTIDGDMSNFFSEVIKSEQFNQYTLTDKKFKVVYLGTETLHGTAIFEENTDRDCALIMESIYINRFLR